MKRQNCQVPLGPLLGKQNIQATKRPADREGLRRRSTGTGLGKKSSSQMIYSSYNLPNITTQRNQDN